MPRGAKKVRLTITTHLLDFLEQMGARDYMREDEADEFYFSRMNGISIKGGKGIPRAMTSYGCLPRRA